MFYYNSLFHLPRVLCVGCNARGGRRSRIVHNTSGSVRVVAEWTVCSLQRLLLCNAVVRQQIVVLVGLRAVAQLVDRTHRQVDTFVAGRRVLQFVFMVRRMVVNVRLENIKYNDFNNCNYSYMHTVLLNTKNQLLMLAPGIPKSIGALYTLLSRNI